MHNKNNIVKIITHDYEETLKLASTFAKTLKEGDVVVLDGDLGAGKTAFTKGVAKGLGIQNLVSSPTFTILHEYIKKDKNTDGIKNIYHFDVYRLIDEEDFFSLGFDEYLEEENSVCIIEWGEKIKDCLPQSTINICIHRINIFDEVLDEKIDGKREFEIYYGSSHKGFDLFIKILEKSKLSYKVLRSLEN